MSGRSDGRCFRKAKSNCQTCRLENKEREILIAALILEVRIIAMREHCKSEGWDNEMSWKMAS